LKAITWSVVAISAAAITAAIFCYAIFLAPADQRARAEKDFRLSSIIWIYAGAFAAIAIAWGLYEILFVDGYYGTGDIF
jgi:hypothetical protein